VPALPVRLHPATSGEPVDVIGLVDSGADCACFPLIWAEILGIDLAACTVRRGSTAGGASEQYHWPTGLRAEIVGVEMPLTAVFTATPVALLGRQDFFRAFRVDFDERNRVFQLTRYEEAGAEEAEGASELVATPAA
jgi:hypothetical protein